MSNPIIVWLALGFLLVVAEALTAPGLGIFLAGLGALFTAALLASGFIGAADVTIQCVAFLILTSVWALVLWKPLVAFRKGNLHKKHYPFENMIGESATVGAGGLAKGQQGQVLWSGTLMNAVLDTASAEATLSAGTAVEINAVSGNLLTVSRKKH